MNTLLLGLAIVPVVCTIALLVAVISLSIWMAISDLESPTSWEQFIDEEGK